MKIYLRLLNFVRPYVPQLLLHTLFVILSVVALGIALSLLDPLLELLFNQSTEVNPEAENEIGIKAWLSRLIQNMISSSGKEKALMYSILIIIGVNITGNIFRYFSNYFMDIVRTGVVQDIRKSLFTHISRLHISYFDGEKKGDILTRLTSDVTEIERSVIATFESVIRDPFTILFFLYLMIEFSWKLTAFSFIVLPITAYAISVIGKSLKRNANKTQNMLSNLMSVIDEFIGGIRVIKAFNAERYVNDTFTGYNEKYSRYARKQLWRQHLVHPISESMGVLAIGGILWFGGNLVFNNEIDTPGFIIFIFYFQQLMSPSKKLSNAVGGIYKGIASGERIFKLFDTPIRVSDSETSQNLPKFEKNIHFENVDFAYDEQLVLKSITLEIQKGRIYALVGPSGGGKTTLAELILRFYDVKSGKITIDGRDIKEIKLHSLRSLIGLVSQDPVLFNDTIYNNIAFGNEKAKREEVIEAAKAAHADEFIKDLPAGYDTFIGDRGVLLSGGQRQRVSIARAILSNPPIMILDEATSALDTKSERIVQDALYKLMQNRTSLVIAHRLSTIQQADEIIVLNKGKIEEQGRHDELIKRGGLYEKLSQMQQI